MCSYVTWWVFSRKRLCPLNVEVLISMLTNKLYNQLREEFDVCSPNFMITSLDSVFGERAFTQNDSFCNTEICANKTNYWILFPDKLIKSLTFYYDTFSL